MQFELKREWDGKEWEAFALRLVQVRHGAQNVQVVPDKVRGDAGIEFLTTDGCCYQCYAPEESADTAKAASAMKSKATRDLGKLRKNAPTIKGLLGERKIARWILLCPFVDDKAVISHIVERTEKDSIHDLDFVGDDFHGLVQSLADFESALTTLRSRPLGIPIDAAAPTPEETSIHHQKVGTQIDAKLERGFPQTPVDVRNNRARYYVHAHLRCADALDYLKNEFPDLWETYRRTLDAEEDRLQAVGSGAGGAAEQLSRELERLEMQLTGVLPLDSAMITIISTGTLATWLIECPLDFEGGLGNE